VDSVLRQTKAPGQIIILDNGSTDRGLDAFFSNPLIEIVRLEGNYPLGFARNLGLERVKMEFVAFLDSDDVWEAHKIETISHLLEIPATHYIHSNYIRINDEGHAISSGLADGLEGLCSREHFRLNEITIGPPSTIVGRAASIRKIGGFNDSFSVSADWDLNQRMSRNYPIIYWPESLVKYRVHHNNLSKNVNLYFDEMTKSIMNNFYNFEIKKSDYRYSIAKLNMIMAGELWKQRKIRFLKYLISSFLIDFRVFTKGPTQ
jgi:glycosyltransferase involved in cell wall biosynthesis